MSKRYCKTFTLNHKRYYAYGKTPQEALTNAIRKQIELEGSRPASNATVKEWALYCVDTYKINLKPETREKYLSKLNHCLIEPIGYMQLSEIRPSDCQQVMNLRQGCSQAYINEVYQMLRFVFGKAYANSLIKDDPTKGLVRPKGYRNMRRAITDEERAAIYSVCEKNDRFVPFLFMLECGLRPAEALFLESTDIIEKNGKYALHVRGTKTKNSDRYVPLSPSLYKKISHREGLIFTMTNLSRYNVKGYQRLKNSFYRALDIELGAELYRNQIVVSKLDPDFCPYSLRHTYVTDLAKQGVNINIVKMLVGHSTIAMTSNIYTNIEKEYMLENVIFEGQK